MCVALAALDAVVTVTGKNGDRDIALKAFHRLPGETPEIETGLEDGELISEHEPAAEWDRGPLALSQGARSRLIRVALVSLAAGLELERGMIKDVRLALGGVAAKPWRAERAEAMLRGGPATEAAFREAAEAELAEAKPLRENGFKTELARRVIADELMKLVTKDGAAQ